MNYELASELKNAGFPREITLPDRVECVIEGEDSYCTPVADYPTLEELIEACGDEKVVEAIKDGRLIRLTSEAVARLWLALNKKHE